MHSKSFQREFYALRPLLSGESSSEDAPKYSASSRVSNLVRVSIQGCDAWGMNSLPLRFTELERQRERERESTRERKEEDGMDTYISSPSAWVISKANENWTTECGHRITTAEHSVGTVSICRLETRQVYTALQTSSVSRTGYSTRTANSESFPSTNQCMY